MFNIAAKIVIFTFQMRKVLSYMGEVRIYFQSKQYFESVLVEWYFQPAFFLFNAILCKENNGPSHTFIYSFLLVQSIYNHK